MNENTIERIGMALADRAYAYRLFHVALGAEPNAEELNVLASEQTRAVFSRLAGSDVAKAKRLATWDEGRFVRVPVGVALFGQRRDAF